MASLQKQYSDIKLQGAVYTPTWVVDKIVDAVGYAGVGILGKTVLDPACGDGRFLRRVVSRILAHSPPDERQKNLQCVYGWDIDSQAVRACKQNLDALTAPYGLSIDWNVSVQNALLAHNGGDVLHTDTQRFDFIVGNPPYIRIQHLDATNRALVKQRFTFCQSGSTDIYAAFFELAYGLLKHSGICGFITPNSYIRTNTGRQLRDFFVRTQAITHIHNFGAVQIFDGYAAYTAITVFSKQSHPHITVYKCNSTTDFKQSHIAYERLQGQLFWDFSENIQCNGTKLKHIAHIFTGLATLADRVFVSAFISENNNIVTVKNKLFGTVQLEKQILKPVIKASKYKQDNQPITEYILFPYTVTNGKADIIPERQLQTTYPLAYAYLCTARPILDKRDAGKPNPVAWYAYGRSQGLTTCSGKKIIFSPMAKEPAFYICDDEQALIYSGYGIKTKMDFNTIKQYLMSDKLKQYMNENGADFAGNWKGYNKTILQEFVIDLKTA